jgi:carbonic anhydrase/acetyltransferase-like protein (isoleucine patch superfamily)
VWYGAVLRGDKNKIKIGRQTNVQDRAVIGTVSNLDSGFPSNVDIGDQVRALQNSAAILWAIWGDFAQMLLEFFGKQNVTSRTCAKSVHVSPNFPHVQVTIGHGALITSSTIGNRVLIGQGAVVQEGSEIGNNSIIAAGAVVLPGKSLTAVPSLPYPPLPRVQCEHDESTLLHGKSK